MGREIERKYLVRPQLWQPCGEGVEIRQGYLSSQKLRTVRVRTKGTEAFLTVKGPTCGITRAEFEYSIPFADACSMLQELCEQPLIEKRRYLEEYAGHTWEIDCFFGENDGLIVAEVELQNAAEPLQLPAWAGAEVSDDPRYFNSNLIWRPYSSWREE